MDRACGGAADDCDDRDRATFAGALELCDGRDNDCDGQVDEQCVVGMDADAGVDSGGLSFTVAGRCDGCLGTVNCEGGDDCTIPNFGSCTVACPAGATVQLSVREDGLSGEHAINAYLNGVRQADCSAYVSTTCTRVVSGNIDAYFQLAERLQ